MSRKSDELDRTLQDAERAVWFGIKRTEDAEATRHFERLTEYREAGDLEGMWDYWTGVQRLRDAEITESH